MEVASVHQGADKNAQTRLVRATALNVLDTLILRHQVSILLQLADIHVQRQLEVDLADPLKVGIHADPLVAFLAHHALFLGSPILELPVLNFLWCVEDVAQAVEK